MGMSHVQLEYRKQHRKDVLVTPTMQVSAYSTGQVMGGVQTISSQEEVKLSDILQSIVVIDPSNQGGQIDIFLFNAPTTGTYTDGSAFAPSAADLLACVGVVNIASADYVAAGSSAKIAGGKNEAMLGRVVKPSTSVPQTTNAASASLYAVAVARGSLTYANGLSYRYQFSQGL